jgi:CRISPR system Cascade subunit CasB
LSSIYELTHWQKSVIHAWWRALQGPAGKEQSPAEGESGEPGVWFPPLDRGHSARLRRASSLHDLAFEEAPHLLFDRLTSVAPNAVRAKTSPLEKALPLIAGAVAHVRDDTRGSNSLAKTIGHGVIRKDEKPAVSELRFQRLLRSRDEEDFFQQLRRVLTMARTPINVAELAQDVFAWQVEREMRTTPTQTMHYRWARDYYLDSRSSAQPGKP